MLTVIVNMSILTFDKDNLGLKKIVGGSGSWDFGICGLYHGIFNQIRLHILKINYKHVR